LGGLAGVNFFPLGTTISGPGVSRTDFEVCQRKDYLLEPELRDKIYEVDAVMRGPIVFRKKLLEKYGYLDEIYKPFLNDDMDYCFRIKKHGFSVFCYPLNIKNKSLTIAKYNSQKYHQFEDILINHCRIFYSRWGKYMGMHRSYLTIPKPIYDYPSFMTSLFWSIISNIHIKKVYLQIRKFLIFNPFSSITYYLKKKLYHL